MSNEPSTSAAEVLPRFDRRKFLALGGTSAAFLLGTAGVAKAYIMLNGATPRSQAPVGLDPATGRELTAEAWPADRIYTYALAGTDGWASLPSSDALGASLGAKSVDPYFPDPLADAANKNLYVFSFTNVTGLDRTQVAAQKGHSQFCAPIIYSTVGDELWITLTNLGLQMRPDLVDGHTLHWHGFRNAIPFYDGVPESSISVTIDHDFTYVYRPHDSGTYMYHCHFEDVEHVTMGMQGIVFVKPDPADRVNLGSGLYTQKAYGVADGDLLGESVYDREFSILLGEIDSRAHFNDAHVQATDWSDFHADFWTMNGRSYPDTLQPNGVRDANGQLLVQTDGGIDGVGNSVLTTNSDPSAAASRLLSNPLSSVVQAEVGERILIRLVNLGFQNHTIQFPGLEVDVLGRDARFVPDSAQRTKTDSVQIGPGESRDVFFKAPLVAGTYPFYNRGLSQYAGSDDGSNNWVGGQRSEIRVYDNLSSQLKPNGWAGEQPWAGEFPVVAKHAGLGVSVRANRTTGNNGGRFISGTITTDTQAYLANIWYVQATKDSPLSAAPLAGHASWNQVPFSGNGPYAFNVQVASSGRNSSNKHYYWVLAQDSAGVYSTPISVQI